MRADLLYSTVKLCQSLAVTGSKPLSHPLQVVFLGQGRVMLIRQPEEAATSLCVAGCILRIGKFGLQNLPAALNPHGNV